MQTFWDSLTKPFFILAPMEDVTDTVFRQIVAQCGRPDVFFTEFTSVEGMVSTGRDIVSRRLHYTEAERPIVAQIWGNNPEHYYQAVQIIKRLKFDGVDINMGCPVNKVVAKGYCAGLIRNPTLAKEIIAATKDAAGDLPVSVKTRIGYERIQTEAWIGTLLETNIAAITIHARTAAEKSKVPTRWEEIGKAVALRNKLGSKTLIIGNGDVLSREEGIAKYKQYGVDGIMIGRGVFHNPWIFNSDVQISSITQKEKIQLLIDHIRLFQKTWNTKRHFEVLKKYYKIYISGMPDAAEFRMQLMNLKDADSTVQFLKAYLRA